MEARIDVTRPRRLTSPRVLPRRSGRHLALPLVAAMIMIALCACASIPHTPPPAHVRESSEYAWERSFDAPPGEWPTREWWTSFQDPQLDRLIAEAFANAPTLAQAAARLRDARARADVTRGGLWPSLSASAAASDEKLTYNGIFPADVVPRGYNWMGKATLDLSWELDFWGRNRKAVSAAVSETKAVQADTASAKTLLAIAVAQSYVLLQGQHAHAEVARSALRNKQESEALVRRRVAEGVDNPASLEQAAARVHLAQAQVTEVEESLSLTRNMIAALLGKGPDRGLAVEPPSLSMRRPVAVPPMLAVDLVGRKPEIVAARWRAEAAAARVGVARTAFYPNVNLAAFIGYESLGLEKLTNSGSDVGNAGAAVHLPLFEGGRLRANYRGARAEYDLAVATYDEAVTQSLRETADALQSLRALASRLGATEAALARSERAYQLARMRYEGGLSDYQAVLLAEDAALETRDAESALRTRGYALDIQLVRALGGGFDVATTDTQAPPHE
jgi:NodT family efflux transporter outer membrane factor (OMF) lipoprotein